MAYKLFVRQLFAFLVLSAIFSLQAQRPEPKERGPGRGIKSQLVLKEMNLINSLQPINSNQSAIMFWRPQKVGSSTILSLLVSYGYRYNVIPRRKTPIVNSLCIKMAACYLNNMNKSDTVITNVTMHQRRRDYLLDYIKRRAYPRGAVLNELRSNAVTADDRAESQHYRISSSHQVCNLVADVVKESMQCAFSQGKIDNTVSTYNFSPNNNNAIDVKELFVVRDPLSRAISVYYFWGELFKMQRLIKLKLGGRGKLKSEENRERKNRRRGEYRRKLMDEEISDVYLYSTNIQNTEFLKIDEVKEESNEIKEEIDSVWSTDSSFTDMDDAYSSRDFNRLPCDCNNQKYDGGSRLLSQNNSVENFESNENINGIDGNVRIQDGSPIINNNRNLS